eukprot:Phypoly_transcript_20374.p1 GENE.Phypoly_transcript_20374~~Phypoly_transcript_20374.p1  ORF type:complete len:176 (-),score=26.87 Phypoly_transcript_20374:92-619(-)
MPHIKEFCSSVGRKKHLVMLVDCYSCKKFILLCKDKKEIKEGILTFTISINKQLPPVKKIHYFYSDKGGEFVSNKLKRNFTLEEIEQTTSASRTPKHNEVAKRVIQTTIGTGRCSLIDTGLPIQFWGDACRMAVIINNAAPSKANPDYKSNHQTRCGMGRLPTYPNCAPLVVEYL